MQNTEIEQKTEIDTNEPEIKKEEVGRFVLPMHHRLVAEAIIKKHQILKFKHKKCYKCRGDGIVAINIINEAVPCPKCVNTYMIRREWHDYCMTQPDIKSKYVK